MSSFFISIQTTYFARKPDKYLHVGMYFPLKARYAHFHTYNTYTKPGSI